MGTPDERIMRSYYNTRGDLSAFDPPAGSASRVNLEYEEYQPSVGGAAPVKTTPARYLGQVTRVLFPDGTSQYRGYNGIEEPEWVSSRDNPTASPVFRTTTFKRDSLHRVYEVQVPALGTYAAFNVGTSWDGYGRPISQSDANGTTNVVYDKLSRVTSYSPPVGGSVTYGYIKDSTNRRWKTTAMLAGVGTWEFREDGKGRTHQVLNPYTQLTSRRFDKDGKILKETRANGAYVEYAHTTRDFLQLIRHRAFNNATIDRLSYAYTDASNPKATGRVLKETDTLLQAHVFTFNKLYELTSETHPDLGAGGVGYTYSLNGNRLNRTQNGVTEWAGHDAADCLLWTNQAANAAPTSGQVTPYRIFLYDRDANPVRIEHNSQSGAAFDFLYWDGAGKMRRMTYGGNDYQATYNGGGDRVTSLLGGVTTTYHMGAGLLQSTTSAGGSTVYTPGVSQRKNGVDCYFHDDWIGSTRYLTDSTGNGVPTAYRFDAYGVQSAGNAPGATTVRFAGAHGYEDDGPNGTMLLGARYYSPALGRFMSPDPIGHAGGLNLYGYVGNDPVNRVDPSGLWETGSYDGDVREVLLGYGDALNPVNWWHGGVGLYEIARTRGAGAAGGTLAQGMLTTVQGLGSDRGRVFGGSTMTVLMAAAPGMKRIPMPRALQGAAGVAKVGRTACAGGGPGITRVRHHTDVTTVRQIRSQQQITPSPRTGAVDVEVSPFGPARSAARQLGAARGRYPDVPAYVEFNAPSNLNRTFAVSNHPRNTGVIPTRHPLSLQGLNPKYVELQRWKFWLR